VALLASRLFTLTYLTATSANAAITAVTAAATTYYVGLHNGSPGNTGANEVSGGSYARQTIQFAAASSGSMASSTAQNFVSMPATTVDHFTINSTLATSSQITGGATSASLTVPSGATVAIASGALSHAVQG
jgi:hypothetical protein